MRSRSFCAWTLVIALGWGATASPTATAAVIRGTFEGTIVSGVDLYEYFGTPSGVLAGEQFSGSLTYDTDLAPLPVGPGTFQSSGMESWLTATIAINGTTWSFDSLAGDPAARNDLSVVVTDDPALDSFSVLLTRTVLDGFPEMEQFNLSLLEESSDFIDGLALPENLTWESSGLFPFQGSFLVDVCSVGVGCTPQFFGGEFLLSRISLEPTMVPEPATLALLGIGLVAAWTRRTRKVASPAYR